MLKSACFFALFLLSAFPGLAQDDTCSLFRISSVSAVGAVRGGQQVKSNRSTFAKIAPDNSLVNTSLSGFAPNSSGPTVDAYVTCMLGFHRYSRKKKKYFENRENRVGFRISFEKLLDASYASYSGAHYDSVPDPRATGYIKNAEVDTSASYNYTIRRTGLHFDFGTVFESNRKHLLTAYVGYMGGVGVSFASTLDAYYSKSYSIYSNGLPKRTESVTFLDETSILKNSFIGTANIVWGLNVRLGKTRKFWSHCVLNAECRTGVSSESLEGYGSFNRFYFGLQGGIKALL
jgi:hypothetical protein